MNILDPKLEEIHAEETETAVQFAGWLVVAVALVAAIVGGMLWVMV